MLGEASRENQSFASLKFILHAASGNVDIPGLNRSIGFEWPFFISLRISTSQRMLSDQFANPKLQRLPIKVQVRPLENLFESIGRELVGWLFICIATAIVFALIFPLISLKELLWEFAAGQRPGSFEIGPIGVPSAIAIFILRLAVFVFCLDKILLDFFDLRRTAKRYRRNGAAELSKDARAPILYLRSFYVDSESDLHRRSKRTHEEDLNLILRDIGPVIAVGKEEESLPLLGATRIYVETCRWQDTVGDLMSFSQLVVIHAGISESLLWETYLARERTDPAKIIISFLAWENFDTTNREFHYEQFREHTSRIFDLPAKLGTAKFLVFTNDWDCQLIGTPNWVKVYFDLSPTTIVRETLRPVLKERKLFLSKWRTGAYILFTAIMAGCPLIIFFSEHRASYWTGVIIFVAIYAWLTGRVIRYLYKNFAAKRKEKILTLNIR